MHWKKTFAIPKEANLSLNATDLLLRMITDADHRLGRNGADEIKSHPFFNGFDWSNVRNKKAPYQPNVKNEISNENFDHFDEEEPFDPAGKKGGSRKVDMKFIGYTYKADVEEQRNMLVKVLKDLGAIQEEIDPNITQIKQTNNAKQQWQP